VTTETEPAQHRRSAIEHWRSPRARFAWWLAVLALAGFAIPIAARLFGFEWRTFAFLVSLIPWVTIGLLVPLVIALAVRSWAMVGAAGAMIALCVVWIAPLYVGSGGEGEPALRVASVNLKFGRADPGPVVEFVRENDIDILALQEVTPEAAAALESAGLRDLLPYSEVQADQSFKGTALWSRDPMADVAQLDGYVSRHIRAQIDTSAGAITVYSVHPAAPAVLANGAWRSDLALLANELEQVNGPVMVVGDFNATHDHRSFRDFGALGYVDAFDQAGAGYQPTYPADRIPFPLVMLDHVLVRDTPLRAISVTTVELPRSDHRALIATYAAS
jgi:endonuclease/exonuclease/phosphatase (EEP) superfamily protein YafD